MAYDIETEEGVITLPVTMVNGRVSFATKAVDKATWMQVAEVVGLVDVEGQPIAATITHVGPVVLSWTTDDAGGRVPDQTDVSHHVNVLLNRKATQRGLWREWALNWMKDGSPHQPNASETGVSLVGITLLDNISSPVNRIG